MPPMSEESMTASALTLPCSRVRSVARSIASAAATPASAAAITRMARSSIEREAHAGWERRAPSTARSSCSGEVVGASKTTSEGRAGLVTG